MRTVLGIVAALLVLAPASPASAGRDGLGLSLDGVTFTPNLQGSLFPSGLRWVPGDVQEGTFYVRNDGASAAGLDIEVLGKESNALLASGELSVTARAAGATMTAGSDGRLSSETRLEPGEVLPVTIRVAYSPDSQNGTQLLAGDLDFRVTLSGDDGVLAGVLPDTGTEVTGWFAVVAATLVAAGSVLARRPVLVPVEIEGDDRG